MKLKSFFVSSLFMGALIPSASAQLAGTVAAVSGEVGSVIVLRDGEIYALNPGDFLIVGDVVTTRRNASVELSLTGCSLKLGGREQIEIDTNACPTGRVRAESSGGETVTAAETTVSSGGSALGGTLGGLSTSTVLLGVAGAATVAALAAGGGGDDDRPVSP